MLTTTTRAVHGHVVGITADIQVQPQTNAAFEVLTAASADRLDAQTPLRLAWSWLAVEPRDTLRHLVAPERSECAHRPWLGPDDLTEHLRVWGEIEGVP